ncbi:MAG: aminoacetone oxidase family FAD-binding enzyme [Epsilonproteobacteria bacterium]|nr:aminoacetone oxidase family FAD-binding enzyme [Campylobacterota bacterium]
MEIFDIVFIGAGASSLMATTFLSEKKVALIDSSSKLAPKIKISGGGKCNFTNVNVSSKYYLGDKNLIKQTFENFGKKELLDFFETHNLHYELRKNGKYFCKNSSNDIIDIMIKLTKNSQFFLNQKVQSVEFKDVFVIKTNKQTIKTKKLVISSGGVSFKSLGASDIGYKIAEYFGHSIATPLPALVGFTLQKEQFWMKNLSGVSLKVKFHVGEICFHEDLLFAHKGISGPSVLAASLYWEKGFVWVDFLPDIKISKLLLQKSEKQISSTLPLPKRFVKEYLKSVDLDDIKVCKLNKLDKQKVEALNHYEFSLAGNFGFSKAEVTKGGVNTNEINHLTFESIMRKNLYFIGEVLDVTGELGGYNFQWAFSSGAVMAKNIGQDS